MSARITHEPLPKARYSLISTSGYGGDAGSPGIPYTSIEGVIMSSPKDPDLVKKPERESIKVLKDCIELQNKKSSDYQAAVSEIEQAEYYPHGVNTIYDIMHAKMLRIKSVLAKIEHGASVVNFESVEDSCMDLINYSSFMVSYLRHAMDGQDPLKDVFNRSLI